MPNLNDLRDAVVRKLQSIPALNGVPVLPEDRMNIDTEIKRGLYTGRGIVITVSTGGGRNTAPAAPVPVCEVDLIVEAGEIPAVNRGPAGRGLCSADAAALIAAALHLFPWTPGRALVHKGHDFIRDTASKLIGYQVAFTTTVEFNVETGARRAGPQTPEPKEESEG